MFKKIYRANRGVLVYSRISARLLCYLLISVLVLALQHTYVVNNQPIVSALDEPYIQKLSRDREQAETTSLKLLFMGDIMLDRSIGRSIEQGENPFEGVVDTLKDHDLRIANIETAVAAPGVGLPANKAYTFNAPLSSLELLKRMQIDISSLANNHTGDYGRQALTDTIEQFRTRGLQSVGAGVSVKEAFNPLLIEKDGFSIGFIAVNDVELAFTKVSQSQAGSAYLDRTLIEQSINQAKDQGADYVIVLPHWGTEYSLTENARQREWGRFMIDAGADLVVGAHPHVIQPTEKYNGKYIVYSLGNFIFDGMSGDALKANMLSVSLEKSVDLRGNKTNTSMHIAPVPVLIDSRGFPQPIN